MPCIRKRPALITSDRRHRRPIPGPAPARPPAALPLANVPPPPPVRSRLPAHASPRILLLLIVSALVYRLLWMLSRSSSALSFFFDSISLLRILHLTASGSDLHLLQVHPLPLPLLLLLLRRGRRLRLESGTPHRYTGWSRERHRLTQVRTTHHPSPLPASGCVSHDAGCLVPRPAFSSDGCEFRRSSLPSMPHRHLFITANCCRGIAGRHHPPPLMTAARRRASPLVAAAAPPPPAGASTPRPSRDEPRRRLQRRRGETPI